MTFAGSLLFALLVILAKTYAETWDSMNAPTILDNILPGMTFQYKLQSLPTEGTVGFKPWSDTYWPDYQRGIANRWNSRFQATSYRLNSKNQLMSMTRQQLKELSPAEKFDIYNGRYDYPTVHTEWSRTSTTTPTWMGLCDGWATSSVAYYQPEPVTLVNSDGLEVYFGSSDIKALLSYFLVMYAKVSPMLGVGGRCDAHLNARTANLPECRDINAGSFHVLLANMIGVNRFAFTFDKDRGHEVWNHPIMQYKTTLRPHGATSVMANTVVLYATETDPKWESFEGKILREDYQYILELDGSGNIVGGHHLTYTHPDSAWILPLPEFNGYFESLKDIYDASVGFKGTRRATTPGVTMDTLPFSRSFSLPVSSFGFDRGEIEEAWSVSMGPVRQGGFGGRRGRGLLQDQVQSSDGAFIGGNLSYTAAEESMYSSMIGSPSIVAGWKILPGEEVRLIRIEFESFNSTSSEMLRVYEEADCSGPLVAAVQGSAAPSPVLVRSSSACLLFVLLHAQHVPNPYSHFAASYQAFL